MLPALPYYTGAGWYVQQKAENIVFFEELYISQNSEDTL